MKHTIIIASLIATTGFANAATIVSSDLDANTLGTTVTWVSHADVSGVTQLTNIGGPIAVLGTHSTDDNISNNANLNAGASQGFTFEFTTTVAMDLTSFGIDAGHVNGSGGGQGYISDLDFGIVNVGGTAYSYSASIDQIDYTSGSTRLPQSFDLTGETIAAGTYQVSISMQEGTANIPGAFSSFDNVALEGVIAVPEPSSTVLLGLGGLALILRRRK